MLFLELVNPWKFYDMRQVFPEEAFQSVLKSYGHHFDSGRLRSELQVLYSDQDLQGNRGKLCDYLVFLKDMELDSAMPQLYKLFSLVATIGATSAGVERSFSCLKRLKSYTRNTMGQSRLSSLALLAIERTLVKSLEKMPSCCMSSLIKSKNSSSLSRRLCAAGAGAGGAGATPGSSSPWAPTAELGPGVSYGIEAMRTGGWCNASVPTPHPRGQTRAKFQQWVSHSHPLLSKDTCNPKAEQINHGLLTTTAQ
ncbi:hypothetical protein PO909_029423 [Leuciscus waleckii]